MRRVLAVVTALVLAGMLWGSARPVAACQCIQGTVREYVEIADVIVVGEIVSYAPGSPHVDALGRNLYPEELSIQVDRYLKGSGPSEVKSAWGWCEPPPNAGAGYIAFLHSYDNRLLDSPCNGSSALDGLWPGTSLEEVEALTEPGIPPDDTLKRAQPPDAGEFPALPAAMAAVLGPVAFLAGAAWVWGRKRGAG